MNFKDMMEKDLGVWYDSDEFAEIHEFWIDDFRYKGAIFLEDGGALDRSKKTTDHVQNIHKEDLLLTAPLSLLKTVPRKGWELVLDKKVYIIVKVREVYGEVILSLERRGEGR